MLEVLTQQRKVTRWFQNWVNLIRIRWKKITFLKWGFERKITLMSSNLNKKKYGNFPTNLCATWPPRNEPIPDHENSSCQWVAAF